LRENHAGLRQKKRFAVKISAYLHLISPLVRSDIVPPANFDPFALFTLFAIYSPGAVVSRRLRAAPATAGLACH
jgi:hypothetical protein